jgi:hypothetical protein
VISALLLLPTLALGAETTMPPKDTWIFDVSYIQSSINHAWDGQGHAVNLIDDIPRYEPGAGLQGILSANPVATYQVMDLAISYGLFDWLTIAINIPIVLRTTVDTNFHWTKGDYQSSIGRQYSLDDFWAWAASLGQPRPPDHWEGNEGQLADMVIGARVLIPQPRQTKWLGIRSTFTLQVALPTGKPPATEDLVGAGTTTWDLHSYGDVEAHLGFDRGFWTSAAGIPLWNLGADVFFSWFRPRTMTTPTGSLNPLILTYAPYVGSTYTLSPGAWFGTTIALDWALIEGPSPTSWLSRKLGGTYGLPPLLSVNVGYTYIATQQTYWQSNSPQWDWDHEKNWQPGDKNIFRLIGTVSLMRLGLPVQLYGGYRSQDVIPGRYTRASDLFTMGARVIVKFW